MPLPTTPYDYAEPLTPTAVLTDFTLMVDLSRMTAGWWSAVNTTQARRGRAFKDDGVTELACDWIDFDSVARTGWLRVKFSGNMTNKNDNTIRVYPPNTSNSVQLSGSAHGSDNAYDADWGGYWPLMSDKDDRTGTHVLTESGSHAPLTFGDASDGPAGNATTFTNGNNGTRSNYLVKYGFPSSDAMTSIGTARPDFVIGPDANWNGIMGNVGAWGHQLNSNGSAVYFRTAGVSIHNSQYTGLLADGMYDGEYHHWAVTADATRKTIVLDGVVKTDDDPGTSLPSGGGQFRIGYGYLSADSTWTGPIQHASYHTVARGDEWISHERDQTFDQDAFWGTWNFSGEASATVGGPPFISVGGVFPLLLAGTPEADVHLPLTHP